MTNLLPEERITSAPIPANEVERLAALYRYRILDTPPEAAFDRITSLAARLFSVPIALVSLVDKTRGWFKSSHGFDLPEVPRDTTICSFALLYDTVLVIPDTRKDKRLACNPFVQSEPGLRFYAGAPLITEDGFNLGTLCLLDTQPREALTTEQQAILADLAAMVVDELELRLAAHRITEIDTALVQITQGVSTATGEAFFYSLVKNLTQALSVDVAFICLVVGSNLAALKTIALCDRGQMVENFEYNLEGTPCQIVIQGKQTCSYPRNIQTYFPQDAILSEMGIESYVATPVFDSTGTLLGSLGVMDRKPLGNVHLVESLLTLFAVRISAELERQQAEEKRMQMLDSEQQYSRQLRDLMKAALAINSTLSVEEVLQVITEQAYQIVGAHQCVTSLTIDNNWAQGITSTHLSDKYAAWQDYDEKPDGSGIYACVCHLNRPMRMTQQELEAHPRWNGFGKAATKHPPMRGWLAAPLTGRDGKNIGLIQLSDKYEGEFTEEDEAIIVQLAQMASVAIENTRLYEAEQQTRTEAETANRIKDEFLAVLSHELRSPLNPILGWTNLLRSRKLNEKAAEKALETIERNAKLQAQLIEDLLDISRILRGKLSLDVRPIELASTIDAAIETVRLAAQAKSIEIKTLFEPNIGQVAGDFNRLQQVVLNLLFNAVKFTPSGGQVEIELKQMGSQAEIRVIDTGKGIDPQFLPYVFESFRQEDGATTRQFGGLGLGLAIVRHLVELHGGTVHAESQGLERGATFTARLPLIKTESSQSKDKDMPSPSASPSSPLMGIEILLVDDDTDTRELIAFVLEEAGATIASASSVAEALQIFAQSKPDVLLSDIAMPEMDGYMFVRQLRGMSPAQGGEIPAIALTAFAGEIDREQALAAGFQMHLTKPIEPEALVQAIARLLQR